MVTTRSNSRKGALSKDNVTNKDTQLEAPPALSFDLYDQLTFYGLNIIYKYTSYYYCIN